MNSAAQPSPQNPQEFGPFLVIGKLGSGGMGKVYLGIEREYDRKVAIKISDAADNLRDEDIRRFEAEAKTMKGLIHQNIIQVFSYGVVGDRQYISMRLINGPTLRERQKNRKKFDLETIVDYAKQIARGLLYAHRKGVVHRDIKPSNILIDEEERLLISDFGISTSSSSNDHLTLPGMAMGTPEYMSPEQCQGFEVTHLSDIYSFGIILYELLTGAPPFTGNKPLATAYKQVNEEPPAVSTLRRDTPPQLATIIEICLAKRADARFSSMEQVLKALDAVEIGSITQMRRAVTSWGAPTITLPVPQQTKQQRNKRILLHTAIIATIAATAFIIGSLHNSGKNGGLSLLPATITIDGERITALEDRDPTSWAAIPQDAEGRPYSLRVDFEQPQLLYTIAITHISPHTETATAMRRTRRPTTLKIENERGQIRTVQLPGGLPGVHYLAIDPLSAQQLRIQLQSRSGEQNHPIALCDLAFIGLTLPKL